MYHLTRIDDDAALTPPAFAEHSVGYRRQVLISQHVGSPHMTLTIGHLDEGGHVAPTLHSFEFSIYILSGELAVTTLGQTTLLPRDHAICIPLGTA